MAEPQMTVAALIDELRIARRTMSEKNPHRHLLERCEAAIVSLAMDLHEARRPTRVRRVWFWRRWLGPAAMPVRLTKVP